MTKRTDWLAAARFTLERSRFVIGELSNGVKPYKSTISSTEQAKLERQARKEAPPRHCICCGKILSKRVSVLIDSKTDNVIFGYVIYGYRGCGYWCSTKCIIKHAPAITTRMLQFAEVQSVGLTDRHFKNASTTRAYYRQYARQIINLSMVVID